MLDGSSSATPSGDKAAGDRDDAGTPSSSAAQVAPPRPCTPPPRETAFEDFKKEQGSEINRQVVLKTKLKCFERFDFSCRMKTKSSVY